MPVVESFVGVLGSFASIIGLSVQLYDRARTGSESLDNERLGLFVALTDITKTWKSIHNEYHVLSPGIREIAKRLSDGRGGIKDPDDIAPAELVATFKQSTLLNQRARHFKPRLEVFFQEPRNRIERDSQVVNQLVMEIRNSLELSVAQSASKIHQSQLSALEAHDNVCQFFDVVAPLLRQSSWKPEERAVVLDKFLNLPDDFDSVILDCDIVLLNVIDLYEYISRDLLESG